MSEIGEGAPDAKTSGRALVGPSTMTAPDFVLENRFAVTPRFAKEWLTDFRADDGRFFGDATLVHVERHGHTVRRELPTPMGPMRMTVDIAKDDAWTVEGAQHAPDGSVLFRFTIRESVAPEKGGTLHRVAFYLTPVGPGIEAMLPQLVAGWKESLATGFVEIKRELEQASSAGKSAMA